ncbi:LacI family transcriptional regulator [Fodinisporobacter ferrooxydans]|uniref:LacI family transcriptional regulator n=1 Tax=Fodinisporobacter ferrooxydans TaxID=2901836 RepID=A0ABY4CE84_9BACL|nr:LacI family transcriptional regulator [Alicyclobacillaceae bacterium MYW30-H2]
MKVNIKRVAQEANVSISTVSRVLNSPELVSPEKRQRVLQVIQELNYQASELARGLSSKKTQTIGVIIPRVTSFFFNELYRGIDVAVKEFGMNILLYDCDSNLERTTHGFTFLVRRQVEGIIYASQFITEELYTFISRLGVPVILALTESFNRKLTAFKVDEVRAAFDAVSYLIARGHHRIAMISGPLDNFVAGKTRYEGYRMALNQHNLPFLDDCVAFGGYRYEDGHRAMRELLEKRNDTQFTALFAASDEMAIGAMRCAFDHGLSVPQDISIIGFDNLSIANMVTPKLTTVSQPFEQIGFEAVRTLIRAISGDIHESDSSNHYLPHQIIERESVASRAIEEVAAADER